MVLFWRSTYMKKTCLNTDNLEGMRFMLAHIPQWEDSMTLVQSQKTPSLWTGYESFVLCCWDSHMIPKKERWDCQLSCVASQKKKKKERLFCLSDQLNQNINTKCCKLPMREWWSSTHTHGFPRNRCRKTKSGRSGGRRLYARPQRPQKKLFQTRYKMTYNTLFLRKVSKWYAAETGCRIGMLIEEKVQRSMKHFIVDTLIFARCIGEYCSCLVTWLQCCTQIDQQRQRSMFSKENWYLCFHDAYHLMLCPAAGGLLD